jgi:hypothetical protein
VLRLCGGGVGGGGGPPSKREQTWQTRQPVGHLPHEAGEQRGEPVPWAAEKSWACGPLLLWARPNRNNKFFDLFKRISKGSDLIRLKDGLPEF